MSDSGREVVAADRSNARAALVHALERDILPNGRCAFMTGRYWKTPFVPTVMTLFAGICWALLMMLYVLLWARDFDWLQNVAIALLSLVVVGCVVGLMWVHWVFRRA